MPSPKKARRFAVEVVRRLRRDGFEAYWAGGCVRDELLGLLPKDYDVATDATPAAVRKLFGHRRTLALGAAFGVITVLGPKGSGQVEVATFRCDAAYSDGRHPDSVRFSTAEEDASRRDFTVNGLFYDPLDDRLIDFVGGRRDLHRRQVRAIGDPRRRIAEDKLRMLRAVRFSTKLDFQIERQTRQAIGEMASQINAVSPERISAELHQIFEHPRRAHGLRLLIETGLAAAVLPEVVGSKETPAGRLGTVIEVIGRLPAGASFSLVFAALSAGTLDRSAAEDVGRRLRFANREIDRIGWLLEYHDALDRAAEKPWSKVQPVLVAPGASELLAWMDARRAVQGSGGDDVAWCRHKLLLPADELSPPPLLTGDDLIRHGVRQGPLYRVLLETVREAQLEGRVSGKEEALALVDQWIDETGDSSSPG